MDLITEDMECKMFAYLREIGCCVICSLRFIGTRNLETFRDPSNVLQKMNVSDDDRKLDDDSEKVACIACLGILQEQTENMVLDQIKITVNKEAHDDPTFNVALTIPVCLFLRDKSVQQALADKFEFSDDQIGNLRLRTQSIKEIWKTKVCPSLEQIMNKRMLAFPIPSPFLIEISFSYKHDTDEVIELWDGKKKMSELLSRKSMENTLATMSKEKFEENYKVPPTKPKSFVNIGPVVCSRSSLFLGGRYAKYSRELSQTPWFINGEKKMETSVQDLICEPMIKLTKADGVKFLSSGREDVDVRNIHSGRPFAVELLNPKVTMFSEKEFDELVHEINESTELVKITTNIKIVDTADLKKLKEGENEKTKVYRALCAFKMSSKQLINLEKLSSMKDLEITQKTPLRVLHRRPLIPRIRVIHAMRARWLRNEEAKKIEERLDKEGVLETSHIENLFVLDIKTQAGTYVKEFVHGDFGRTKPSLGDILGAEFDIVALDVTAINLDWP